MGGVQPFSTEQFTYLATLDAATGLLQYVQLVLGAELPALGLGHNLWIRDPGFESTCWLRLWFRRNRFLVRHVESFLRPHYTLNSRTELSHPCWHRGQPTSRNVPLRCIASTMKPR